MSSVGSLKNTPGTKTVAGGGAAAAPKPAAKSPVGGFGVAYIPPPSQTPAQTPVPPSTPLYEACKACTFKELDVAHKAAIITSLRQLTFTDATKRIDICLKPFTHPITSILCENVKQRDAIIVSLKIIQKAALEASDLAKHFDEMVKSGLDKLLIDCCVKADEEAACAAACVSIAALTGKSSTLAGDCGHLTKDKAELSERLNSPETTKRLSAHQTLTTDTEALRLDIQALQHSQLSTAVGMDAHAATLKEVNAYNAAIQAQNTALATQKAAIVELGKQIQQKKTKIASSLNPQKVALDARHVELKKKAQSLSALKSGLTDAISSLDVMITASNSGLAYVGTEFVEAALSKWALAQLGPLVIDLGSRNSAESFLYALTQVQTKIRDKTVEMTAAAFSQLYGKLNARPAGTDAAIEACLTEISTQLATFDREYQEYSDLLAPYQEDVTQFNQANATALSEVNTLVESQANAITKLKTSLEAASVENNSKKSGLTVKIDQLNQAIQTAGTATSARTADLNTKITQYNANIETLKQMEADQQLLVNDVSSSNTAIQSYNQDVAGLKDAVSVAKKQVAHIKQYNDSTNTLAPRTAIKKQIMSNEAAVTAAFKAILQQSPPSTTGSGGASGSDPYISMPYDDRVLFSLPVLPDSNIPPQIPRIDCRSLSSSFEPIAVATGRGIEPIQVILSEITVVIPEAEEGFLDITVPAATAIAREFPSIGMLAQPNQPEITVRAPFITKEMLKTHGDFLNKISASSARITKWKALIDAVGASKDQQATCPVQNQAKQDPFLKTLTGQQNGNVWSFTQAENGEFFPTYHLDYQMTGQGKEADNSTKTNTLNARIETLQRGIATKPPIEKK